LTKSRFAKLRWQRKKAGWGLLHMFCATAQHCMKHHTVPTKVNHSTAASQERTPALVHAQRTCRAKQLRLHGPHVAESKALSYRGGGTTTRASEECATAVILFRERTAGQIMEIVVCFSSSGGDDRHQGCHQQSLFVGVVANRGCHQQSLFVGAVANWAVVSRVCSLAQLQTALRHMILNRCS